MTPKFRVIVQPEAEGNITEILTWIAERSAQGANAWHAALVKAIEYLGTRADSMPLAHESRHFDCEIRELLFKTRRGLSYRLLFTIQGSDVHLLYVRGPGQDSLPKPEL